MTILPLVIIFLVIYFLPTIYGYDHRNSTSIFILNLFLGWTLIGWVIALIWAFSNDKKVVVVRESINQESSFSDEIRKLKGLLDEGIITNEEFETKKKKILDE